METELNVNSTLSELKLIKATLDIQEDLKLVYSFFEGGKNIPGICLLNKGEFNGLLSRSKFFEIMSKQFMFDLYSKRNIEFFFEGNRDESHLVLESNTKVTDALDLALKRPCIDVYEPIVVSFSNKQFKVLDFYELILAQSKILGVINNLLNEANEFKNEVLAIVAHDLRNPIGAIKGFSRLITDSSEDKEDQKHHAEIIFKTAGHMEDLVSNFLSSVRKESTDLELSISTFDLLTLIDELILNLKHLAESKNQKIRFSTLGESFEVKSDRLKIGEVIENLVTNAIKYAPFCTEISILAFHSPNYVNVSITDEGPGFTEEDKLKIYGKFQRLSAKPIGDGTSTGIGLFTVKKIIDKLKGEITLDIVPGEGSTFTMSIPV